MHVFPRTASGQAIVRFCQDLSDPRATRAAAHVDAFVGDAHDEEAIAAGRRLLRRVLRLPPAWRNLRHDAAQQVCFAVARRATHFARAERLVQQLDLEVRLRGDVHDAVARLAPQLGATAVARLRSAADAALRGAAMAPQATFFLAERSTLACLAQSITHEAPVATCAMQTAWAAIARPTDTVSPPSAHREAALMDLVRAYDWDTWDTLHDMPQTLRSAYLAALAQALDEAQVARLTAFYRTGAGKEFARHTQQVLGLVQQQAAAALRGVLPWSRAR